MVGGGEGDEAARFELEGCWRALVLVARGVAVVSVKKHRPKKGNKRSAKAN